MVCLTPIIEEAINRGLLLYSLLNNGRLFAIILSSVLFAIMHSPGSIATAFVGGLFFAAFALNRGTLWAPLMAHATYNGLIIVDWMCLNGTWNPQSTTPSLTAVGIVALSVTALSLYWCSRLVRGKCVGTNNLPQRPR
jgi:membrane protease YdiL (CAAX protease family)